MIKVDRRRFLAASASLGISTAIRPASVSANAIPRGREGRARIAVTLDLEMSRNYPTWDQMHWDYEKGNLDTPTKNYALEAARRIKGAGGRIHFFCVARVLEQENVDWLKQLIAEGHPIGNHTYDHVNVGATRTDQIQFRFQRAPWLIEGKTAPQVISENIRLATLAMKSRLGINPSGFRTPGGFANGLVDRPDVQKLILDQGFTWVSSKYPAHSTGKAGSRPGTEEFESAVKAQAEAQPFRYPSGLIEVPMSPVSDVTTMRGARWSLDEYLDALKRCVAWAIEHRATFDFLAHPSCLVATDPTFRALTMITEMVAASKGQAEFVTLDDLARDVPASPAKS